MLFDGDAAVVKADLELGAGNETLVVIEIVGVGVLIQGGRAAGERRRLRCRGAFQLQGSREHWVHHLRRRPGAVGRDVDASGPGRSSPRPQSMCRLDRHPKLSELEVFPDPLSVPCTRPAADAQKIGTGPGPQQLGVGNIKVVALDGDIVVVLQAENDGVRQAQINLAIVHQAHPDAGNWWSPAPSTEMGSQVLRKLGKAWCGLLKSRSPGRMTNGWV